MRRWLIIAAALAGLSCGSRTTTIRIHRAFPPVDRAEVKHAIDDWNEVTLGQFEVADDGEWQIVRAALDDGVNGETIRSTHTVLVHEAPRGGATTYSVTKHELGHVRRLRHPCIYPTSWGEASSSRPCDPTRSLGVMDPIHTTTTFSYDDMRECRAIGECP